MPNAKSIPFYQNFDLIKAAIAAKSLSLIMVTTEVEYAGLLLSRGNIYIYIYIYIG